MSASVVMMGIMMLTGADVQQDQEQIQQIEIVQEAAVEPLVIDAPEGEVIARTHIVHVFTQEDADMIKRVAMAEAGNEGADGLWMVASVIVNRVNDPSSDFPDTVYGVIHQKNAFATVTNGAYDKVTAISDECEEAFARIEAGDICPEIIAFEGTKSNVLDKWFMEAFTYRHHKFYTKK